MVRSRSSLRSVVPLIALAWGALAGPIQAATQPEQASSTRAEITFDNAKSWRMRAVSRLIVGQGGTLAEPVHSEGFAAREVLAMSFQVLVRQGQPVQSESRPHDLDLFREPARFGLIAGDVIEQETIYRFQPLVGNAGLDQVFVFPNREQPHKVSLVITGEKPEIRLESNRLAMQRLVDADGPRTLFDAASPPAHLQRGMSHALETAPRLSVSSHVNHAALAAFLPQPDLATALLPLAGAETDPLRLANVLMAEVKKLSAPPRAVPLPIAPQRQTLRPMARVVSEKGATPLEAAILLRDQLLRHGLKADLLFANDRMFSALPRMPVGLFDTVMVAVPAHGLVLDLSMEAASRWFQPDFYGREMLRVSGQSANLEILPRVAREANRIVVRADLTVGRDGIVEGQSVTTADGPSSVLLRDLAGKFTGSSRELLRKVLMERQGLEGLAQPGTIEDRGDQIHVHLGFRLNAPGGSDHVQHIATIPGPSLYRPPLLGLLLALKDPSIAEIPCRTLILEQDFIVHLPDRRALVEMPKNVQAETEIGRYSARYRLEDARLHVSRKLELDPPSMMCNRDQLHYLAPVIRAAARDMSRKLHVRMPDG